MMSGRLNVDVVRPPNKIWVRIKYFGRECLEWSVMFLSGVCVAVYLLFSWFRGSLQEGVNHDVPPSCLLDSVLGSHRFVKLKKVKLHFVESGNPENPLVILIHGSPDFWFTWRRQIPDLSRDYWVVAVDLRGCGDSDTLRMRTQYTTSLLAEDIASLICCLGRKSAHLVCAGTGGLVGWHMAYYYPHLISKMVLVHSPHPYIIRHQLNSMWINYIKLWYMYFVRIPLLPELMAVTGDMYLINRLFRHLVKAKLVSEEEVEAYKFTFSRREDWVGPLHQLRKLDLTFVDEAEPIPDVITKPTLLIMGEEDPVLPIDTAYRSAEYVERITIKPVSGSGYFTHVSKAAEVNQMISEFLRELSWRPLSPLETSSPSSSLVGRVMGAGMAAVTSTVNKTSNALEITKSFQGGIMGIAHASMKAAESTLGLDNMY